MPDRTEEFVEELAGVAGLLIGGASEWRAPVYDAAMLERHRRRFLGVDHGPLPARAHTSVTFERGPAASSCRISISSRFAGEPRWLMTSIGLASVRRLSRVSRRMRWRRVAVRPCDSSSRPCRTACRQLLVVVAAVHRAAVAVVNEAARRTTLEVGHPQGRDHQMPVVALAHRPAHDAAASTGPARRPGTASPRRSRGRSRR